MRRLNGAGIVAALLLGSAVAYASSSLVLTDGQVIKGTDVTRQGDAYLVTMVGGNTVAFPAALVKEIKFEDDPPPPTPAGFDYAGPRTLAGPPFPRHRRTTVSRSSAHLRNGRRAPSTRPYS